ncbi:hypothetical protein AKO1_011920 [Acrasis kona]|uniref:Uncharacterized protein n=1 Tax=Acrasis kona TaxID=1008807 RepID=A0AAW2Z8U9_9EUKA
MRVPANIWSYLSGFIAAIAWLLIIDAQVYDSKINVDRGYEQEMRFINWIPVIPATLAWIMLNVVPVNNLKIESDHDHDQGVRRFAVGWTFVSVFLLFGSCVAGVTIMIHELIQPTTLYTWGHITTL